MSSFTERNVVVAAGTASVRRGEMPVTALLDSSNMNKEAAGQLYGRLLQIRQALRPEPTEGENCQTKPPIDKMPPLSYSIDETGGMLKSCHDLVSDIFNIIGI
jgi:hypothetical protein